jgi:DNA topoisomerase-1
VKKLVVVESPTKVRSISKYLGSEYQVEASVGHIRDLYQPKDIPKAQKAKYGVFSVDINHNFEPLYTLTKDAKGASKKKLVDQLKKQLLDSDTLYLATDPDREGEAIAWHLQEVLKPKVPVKRMVFNEVTKESVLRALEHTREIDERLVDAQEARRIVDRLYGYKTSPILWKKVARGLSAGRVQSPATRLLVEREIERSVFIPANYYSLSAFIPFEANLKKVESKTVANGGDFDDKGVVKSDVLILDQKITEELMNKLQTTEFRVSNIKASSYKRSPRAPFTTSTLQQAAGSYLGLSAYQTMRFAQTLYENGFITYMRTDSTHLSDEGLTGIRTAVAKDYSNSLFQKRIYSTKSANAQEAHEAIRPAGSNFKHPDDLPKNISDVALKLYALIYNRTLASQMIDCLGETTSISIQAGVCEFGASGTVITQPGWTLAWNYKTDDRPVLPKVTVGQVLQLEKLEPQAHQTKPPARYTEGSLVKTMEELGIGRPSTYANIIQTILNRGYATKLGSALIPSWTAFSVVKLMTKNLSQLVDYDFTAKLETQLDEISEGKLKRTKLLHDFYFGNSGLEKMIDDSEIDTQEINTMYVDPERRYRVRIGQRAVVLEDTHGEIDESGNYPRAFVPVDLPPADLSVQKAEELLKEAETKVLYKSLGIDPETGFEVSVQQGPYGPYVKIPTGKKRPEFKNASLLKSMSLETITLDQAMELLALPRTIGVDDDGQTIQAANGRFGPYLKKGSDFRSLQTEDQIFSTTLDEAKAIYAEPKKFRRGRKRS